MKKANVPSTSRMRGLSILSVSRTSRPSGERNDRRRERHRDRRSRAPGRASARRAGRRLRPSCQTEVVRGIWDSGRPCAGGFVTATRVFQSHFPPFPTPPNAPLRCPGKSAEHAVDAEREELPQLGSEVPGGRGIVARGAARRAGRCSRAGMCTGARAGPRRARRATKLVGAQRARRRRRAGRCRSFDGPTRVGVPCDLREAGGRREVGVRARIAGGREVIRPASGASSSCTSGTLELARAAPAGSRPRRTARRRARRARSSPLACSVATSGSSSDRPIERK